MEFAFCCFSNQSPSFSIVRRVILTHLGNTVLHWCFVVLVFVVGLIYSQMLTETDCTKTQTLSMNITEHWCPLPAIRVKLHTV